MEIKKESTNFKIVKLILQKNKDARDSYADLYFKYYSCFFDIKHRTFYNALKTIELEKKPKTIVIYGKTFHDVRPASIQTLARLRRLVQSMNQELRPSFYVQKEEEEKVRKEIKEFENDIKREENNKNQKNKNNKKQK